MAKPSSKRASTRVSRIVKAEREAVYHAFLDPDSVALWFAPDNMKGRVHAFDARVGGTFRMSLNYQDQAHPVSGKTSEDTDTFQGRLSNSCLMKGSLKPLCSSHPIRHSEAK